MSLFRVMNIVGLRRLPMDWGLEIFLHEFFVASIRVIA
jgi:hypothetical protein